VSQAASLDVETQDEAKKILVYDFLGFSIFVGCNAKANEALVSDHKTNHPKCFWLHTMGRRGPSVVLCLGHAPDVPPEMIVMRYAASRALKLSGLKKGRVVYSPLDDVYKPEQGSPGIYRTWRTSFVEL